MRTSADDCARTVERRQLGPADLAYRGARQPGHDDELSRSGEWGQVLFHELARPRRASPPARHLVRPADGTT